MVLDPGETILSFEDCRGFTFSLSFSFSELPMLYSRGLGTAETRIIHHFNYMSRVCQTTETGKQGGWGGY